MLRSRITPLRAGSWTTSRYWDWACEDSWTWRTTCQYASRAHTTPASRTAAASIAKIRSRVDVAGSMGRVRDVEGAGCRGPRPPSAAGSHDIAGIADLVKDGRHHPLPERGRIGRRRSDRGLEVDRHRLPS